LGVFFFLTRKWVFPLPFGILLLAIYFGFFAWAYFGRDSWLIWRNIREFLGMNLAFLLVGPLPGLAWMLYARAARRNPPETFVPTGLTRRTFAYTLVLMGLCLTPWLPARNQSVGRPKDINSVTIGLKRGSCFGMCPIYTINIHGSGLVEYQGQRFVGAKGLKTATITADSLAKLLGSFDQEQFFALDDRAFENCFDTPYATITISVDGKSKTVTGDECMAISGPKAVLRDLAQKIDDTAGSLQWVECKGRCQY